MVMQEQQVRAKLREWIVKRAKVPPGADFSDQTKLLEQSILSSLDIVEFVLFIESLRGADIEVDDIEPEVFSTIDSLYESFFAAA